MKIAGVTHSGTHTLAAEFGGADVYSFHRSISERMDAVTLRDPLEVACSWTSRGKRGTELDEQAQWERCIAYIQSHGPKVYPVEQFSRIENEKPNTADVEVEKDRLRQWIEPHVCFFRSYGYAMNWL